MKPKISYEDFEGVVRGYCRVFVDNAVGIMINNTHWVVKGKRMYFRVVDGKLGVCYKVRKKGGYGVYEFKEAFNSGELFDLLMRRTLFLERLIRDFEVDEVLLSVEDVGMLSGLNRVVVVPELLCVNLITDDYGLAEECYEKDLTGVVRLNRGGTVYSYGRVGKDGHLSEILKKFYLIANYKDNVWLGDYYLSSRKNKSYDENGKRLGLLTDYVPLFVEFSNIKNLFVEEMVMDLGDVRLFSNMAVVENTTLNGGRIQNLGVSVEAGRTLMVTKERIKQVFGFYVQDRSVCGLVVEVLLGLFHPEWFGSKGRIEYLVENTGKVYSKKGLEKAGVDINEVVPVDSLTRLVTVKLKDRADVRERVLELLERVKLEDVLQGCEVDKYGYCR